MADTISTDTSKQSNPSAASLRESIRKQRQRVMTETLEQNKEIRSTPWELPGHANHSLDLWPRATALNALG